MKDPRIEQTPVDKLLDEIQRLRDENTQLLRLKLRLGIWENLFGNMIVYRPDVDKKMTAREIVDAHTDIRY